MEDYSQLDDVLKRLGTFDWLVFTSTNGARFFFDQMYSSGADARSLSPMKVAVIGKTTAKQLLGFGIVADVVPDTESSTGLLEKFDTIEMKNKQVLLPQAKVASKELPQGLIKLGAKVETIPVYQTVEMEPEDVDFEHIDKILFTSGSTVKAFVKKFGKVPPHIKACCLGLPTQTIAKENGIEAEILPH